MLYIHKFSKIIAWLKQFVIPDQIGDPENCIDSRFHGNDEEKGLG